MPRSFNCLLEDFQNPPLTCDDQVWKKYQLYFQYVRWVMPQRDEPYAILAYLSFKFGNDQEAVHYWDRAHSLNPYNFWYPYNLGVVYFKLKNFNKAAEWFNQALRIQPKNTINVLFASKIFRDIQHNSQFQSGVITEQLKKGYENASRLNTLSKTSLKHCVGDIAQIHTHEICRQILDMADNGNFVRIF